MRILQAATFVDPTWGRTHTFLDALGRGYRDAGHDVISVVPGAADADETTAAGRRITLRSPVLSRGSAASRVLVDADRVRAVVEAARPDCLEVSDCVRSRGLGGWAQERGLPAVALAHQRVDALLCSRLPHAAATGRIAGRLADHWNRRLAERFDTVVCTSDWIAAELSRAGVRNLAQVPPGVDLETFSPDRRSDALRRWFAPSGGVLLACVSRLAAGKRVDVAIGVVRVLLRRGIDVHLVIAGAGPQAARLKAAARGLPVTFLGPVHGRGDVARLLATADVAICPGPAEPLGLAALEAMACGTPVVTARTGSLPELVAPGAGEATWSHPRAACAAIRLVLETDPDQRRSAARSHAECFPWSATVDRLLGVHDRRRLPA